MPSYDASSAATRSTARWRCSRPRSRCRPAPEPRVVDRPPHPDIDSPFLDLFGAAPPAARRPPPRRRPGRTARLDLDSDATSSRRRRPRRAPPRRRPGSRTSARPARPAAEPSAASAPPRHTRPRESPRPRRGPDRASVAAGPRAGHPDTRRPETRAGRARGHRADHPARRRPGYARPASSASPASSRLARRHAPPAAASAPSRTSARRLPEPTRATGPGVRHRPRRGRRPPARRSRRSRPATSGRPTQRRTKRKADPAGAAKADSPPRGPKIRFSDRDPAVELAITEIAGHLTFTPNTVTAWYWLPEVRWAFRPDAEREALLSAISEQYAGLAGFRLHLRRTTRPFPADEWARTVDSHTPKPLPDVPGATVVVRPSGRRPAAPAVGQPRRGPDLPRA